MHKILLDFEKQVDHLIRTRKKRNEKENLLTSGHCRPGGKQSENQRKGKKRQVLRCCQRTKKGIEYEGGGDINYNWRTQSDLQRLNKGSRRIGNR